MNAFLEQLSRIGPARLIVMFGVAAGVAGALMALSMGLGRPQKALLFSGLEMTEAAEMAARLEQSGLDYEFSAGGTAIMVDKNHVLDARMMLSAEGMPASGSVGYEIFDSQDGFGATQFVQNVNRVRALEGELARTIRSLDGVASARVHLALPERRLFDRSGEEAKASVWIELRQDDLAARHARAIRNLVAGAVPGLKTGQVTILDSEGRLLSRGEEGDDPFFAAAEERRTEIEERLRRRLVSLIEAAVGRGGVEVQVAVEVDNNRITESSELFDPESQVVVSTVTSEENSDESDRERAGAASASASIPDGTSDSADSTTSQAVSRRSQETINYEVSHTSRTEIKEAGAIERISVAIAVDGVTMTAEDGTVSWTPRSDEELARIEALAKSAIGFTETRGDTVEVANVRFARLPAPTEATGAPGAFSFNKDDIMRGAELFVLIIVAAMIIFLVARPLISGIPAAAGGGVPALAGAAAGGGAVSVEQADTLTLTSVGGGSGAGPALPSPKEDGIDVAQIQGQVRASSVRKVAEIVEKHPEDSVSILRTWLHED